MSAEIASAYVRIRPNTAGFQSETESQVKHGLRNIGGLIAAAFAIKGTFDFGKQIVTHAADVQKQVEAVKAEFGAASGAVLAFGQHGATALGVSAHEADTTAARFGILGKTLGLVPSQTAALTLGFEKLAGSVSQIRNVNPEQLFTNLPLVLAGNTRSLRQLGIATDQNQLKIAAFKAGITDSITQALTPGQKALAIYAVATAHLGELQAQAQSHAGDLANVQRRLSAEWDNARDSLGRGLLPPLATLTGYLADHLPGAITKIRDDFRDFASTIKSITAPIGGVKGAVEGLIAAFAVGKIVAFAGAIRTDLIANGTRLLAREFQVTEGEVVGAYTGMELATIGLRDTIRGALISTGIGAIAVAAGIAAELVINHWSTVKRWFSEAAAYIKAAFNVTWQAIQQGAKAAAYGIIEYFTYGIQKVLELASHLPFVGHYARSALDAIQTELDLFRPDFSKLGDAWKIAGTQAGQSFAAAARKAAGTIAATNDPNKALAGLANQGFTTDILTGVAYKSSAETKKAIDVLNTQLATTIKTNTDAISKARASLATARQSLADAIRQQGVDVAQAVQQAKDNLVSLGSGIASSISTFIDNGPLGQQIKKLQDALTGRQQGEQRKQLVAAVKTARKELDDMLAAVGPQGSQERGALDSFLAPQRQNLEQAQAALSDFNAQNRITGLQARQQTLKDSITRGVADLTYAFNRGGIDPAEFNTRISALLAKGGANYRTAGKVLGVAFAGGLRDQVTAILQQAFAINAGPHLAGVGGTVIRPLEVLRKDQQDIAKAQHVVALKQTTLQERIAKAAEQTAAEVKKINAVQIGPTPNVKPPGRQTTPTSTRRR